MSLGDVETAARIFGPTPGPVVVRAGMTMDMADLFLEALRQRTESLESLESPLPQRRPEERESFKH